MNTNQEIEKEKTIEELKQELEKKLEAEINKYKSGNLIDDNKDLDLIMEI